MIKTARKYTVDDLTEEFVHNNLDLWRSKFADDASWQTYIQAVTPLRAALAAQLTAWASATDADRTRLYNRVRKQAGHNRTAPKGEKWGPVQRSIACGGGLRWVDCAGHGGFLISPARQAAIPAVWRESDNAYEEDCDFEIIGLLWPSALLKQKSPYYVNKAREWSVTAEEAVRRACAAAIVTHRGGQVREVLADDVGVAA